MMPKTCQLSRWISRAALLAWALSTLTASAQPRAQPATPAPGTKATLAILETTDLHTNVLGYDYFKLAEDKTLGFDRTLRLIQNARSEFANTVLLDNGDTIQGTALADFQAVESPLLCGQTLAMYRVMNAAGYDGGGIGNHEFNYGLKFLQQATGQKMDVAGLPPLADQTECAGPKFPLVLANVHSVQSKAPIFAPFAVLPKSIVATTADGKTATVALNIGIIGFTPPAILKWDKRWLEGKLYTVGTREALERYLPQMKAQGADLIVVITHSGLDASPYSPDMENSAYHLAQVPGVDALLLGHSHQVFPSATSRLPQFNSPGVDKVAGTVHGVPTVMSGFWGKSLGVIALQLEHDGKAWRVNKAATKVEQRSTQLAGGGGKPSFVEPVDAVAQLIAAEHAATIAYVKTPLGQSDFRMTSYFAEVGDVSAVQLVNMAQAAYLQRQVADGLPQFSHLPVLSLSAPFKSGFGGGNDYTDVPAGDLAINNAADLYLYPNTLYGVKVSGADLVAWLEQSAKRFNRIDPAKVEPQELLSSFPGYNFDMATHPELRYTIDVTQAQGQRVRDITWQGKALDPNQQFLAATNNYRASGGGSFPGMDGSKTIFAGPDTNRDVLIDYLRRTKAVTRKLHGASSSWSFAKVTTAGPVTFKSAAGKLDLAIASGIGNLSVFKADDGSGRDMAVYAIDLSR